jgi:hemoglobin-like flavoprotein
MQMNNSDLELLAATRPLFKENGEMAAALFYKRLFELAPGLRGLFPENLAEQYRKLSGTLAVAINAMHDWEELAPILASLARRHVAYGAKPQHYSVVTIALLDTLRASGTDRETVDAWNRGMSMICTHMIKSAYGQDAVPPRNVNETSAAAV